MARVDQNIGMPPRGLATESALFGGDQLPLFHRRISTILPPLVNGADISFSCFDDQGDLFFCKDDKPPRPIRATEWILTGLAAHLGIVTAHKAILTDAAGLTYFGSRSSQSIWDAMQAQRFLTTPVTNELGQNSASWPGQYLARLYVFDMFVGNDDRSLQNFLVRVDGLERKICAIDFASASLKALSSCKFPVAQCHTVTIGKMLRMIHGEHRASMLEMADRIASVPSEIIGQLMAGMPTEWYGEGQRDELCERWVLYATKQRLDALRQGITSGEII